jgi:phospholipase/carboxylesterase
VTDGRDGHGTYDPVISVDWGRRARRQLAQAGADVLYREYPLPHAIDPRYLDELAAWVSSVRSSIRASTAE